MAAPAPASTPAPVPSPSRGMASPLRWGDVSSSKDEGLYRSRSYCEVLRSCSPPSGPSSPRRSPVPVPRSPASPTPRVPRALRRALRRPKLRAWPPSSSGGPPPPDPSRRLADRGQQASPAAASSGLPASPLHEHPPGLASGSGGALLQMPQRGARCRHVHQRASLPPLPSA
nr:SH3 domain-binding protein 1-like [Aegilops tauschii subsp. strangulata]